MDQRMEENKPWMAVPQFGGWEQKSGSPDYSMVFSRARANRKEVKTTINRASLGAETELKALQRRNVDPHQPVGFTSIPSLKYWNQVRPSRPTTGRETPGLYKARPSMFGRERRGQNEPHQLIDLQN